MNPVILKNALIKAALEGSDRGPLVAADVALRRCQKATQSVAFNVVAHKTGIFPGDAQPRLSERHKLFGFGWIAGVGRGYTRYKPIAGGDQMSKAIVPIGFDKAGVGPHREFPPG